MTECLGMLAFCVPALDHVCGTHTCLSTSTFMPVLMWFMRLWPQEEKRDQSRCTGEGVSLLLTENHHARAWGFNSLSSLSIMAPSCPSFVLPRWLQPLNGPSTLFSPIPAGTGDEWGARGSGTSSKPSEDVFGLDHCAHRSQADSRSDMSYFISGFGLLPPHCAVINTGTGMACIFHTFSALSLFNCVSW